MPVFCHCRRRCITFGDYQDRRARQPLQSFRCIRCTHYVETPVFPRLPRKPLCPVLFDVLHCPKLPRLHRNQANALKRIGLSFFAEKTAGRSKVITSSISSSSARRRTHSPLTRGGKSGKLRSTS